jgi:hypothetical protein
MWNPYPTCLSETREVIFLKRMYFNTKVTDGEHPQVALDVQRTEENFGTEVENHVPDFKCEYGVEGNPDTNAPEPESREGTTSEPKSNVTILTVTGTDDDGWVGHTTRYGGKTGRRDGQLDPSTQKTVRFAAGAVDTNKWAVDSMKNYYAALSEIDTDEKEVSIENAHAYEGTLM